MGVDYFVCAAPGCEEVINDHGDYTYLEIVRNKEAVIEGWGCDNCQNLGDTYNSATDTRFLIKFFWKNPNIEDLKMR